MPSPVFVTQPGPGYGPATSATSLSVGTGTKSFTTQAGLAFQVGSPVVLTSTSTGDWMYGTVSSYSSTSMSVVTTVTSGASSHSDWTISLCGIIQSLPGSWQTPTLLNSWSNAAGGYASRYRTEAGGTCVRLSGKVSKTSVPLAGSIIYTLPLAYRPAFALQFIFSVTVSGSASVAIVQIDTSGNITLLPPGNNVQITTWFDGTTYSLS